MTRAAQQRRKAIKKTLTPDEEASTRVDSLFEEAEKFCAAVGLPKDLMHEIYAAENDWTFILKIDALLETATKELIKSGLKLKILNRFVGAEALAEFVDGLPMNRQEHPSPLAESVRAVPGRLSGSLRPFGASETLTLTTSSLQTSP